MALKTVRFPKGLLIISLTEIIIGTTTLAAVFFSVLNATYRKPLPVLLFVVATAVISLSLGIGVLRLRPESRRLLLFFSSVIIINKIMIFLGVLNFPGGLEVVLPDNLKNAASIFYHSLVIYYLTCGRVRNLFVYKQVLDVDKNWRL